jgi:hypothetical protein
MEASEFLTPPAAPPTDVAPPETEPASPPPTPPDAGVAVAAGAPLIETVPIPVHHVTRIRELLDVMPATEAARVGQIRALLPELV